jgi:hypothetical protein
VLDLDVGDWGSIAPAEVEIAEENREYEHSLEDEAPAADLSGLVDCVRYRGLPYSGSKGVNEKRLKSKIVFDGKIAGDYIRLLAIGPIQKDGNEPLLSEEVFLYWNSATWQRKTLTIPLKKVARDGFSRFATRLMIPWSMVTCPCSQMHPREA